jgi:hypothetical protein
MSTTIPDPTTAAINRNLTEHPEWIGDPDRCAACGREIPKKEKRIITILGSGDGEDILITRYCVDCTSV